MLQLRTPSEAAKWLHARVKGMLQTDSRKVAAGDGFIAWPGAATDGRRFVSGALAQGASACLVEAEGVESWNFEREDVAAYPQLKEASGPIAAVYYEEPSRQMGVIAVTGTNGKTSTSWWLAQALSALPKPVAIPCGLVGTLGVGRVPHPGADTSAPAQVVSTGLTTPDPVLLQQTLRRFVDEGLQACAMEASSIGIEQRRLDGTQIRTAIFTNFTQDHLDYHGTMQAYWKAKAALFDWPGLTSAVVNVDDDKGAELAATLSGRPLDLWTVSCKKAARLQARDIHVDARGLRFAVCEGAEQRELSTQLIGSYNVSNLLGVIGAMRSLGVTLEQAVSVCHELAPVPGRMDCQTEEGQPMVVVDYAHTPDALAKALEALRPVAQQRDGRLWCVFGCGGDRDASKRPAMGAVAAQYADEVVVTSDNPRSEKPQTIISQILLGLEGCTHVSVEPDRARAIDQALQQAGANDVLLVAGKGHEDYQEINGVRVPFSDRDQVHQAMQARAAARAVGGAG